MPAGTKPSGGGSSHKAVDVEPIGPTVEGKAWFVKPCLRRHSPDRIAGDIRGVHRKHPHAVTERNGKGIEQVPLVHLAAQRPDVPPGASYSSGIEIRSVEFQLWVHSKQGGTHGSGPAAEIHHNTGRNGARRHGAGRGKQFQRRLDKQFGPAAGHKDAWPYFDPLAKEPGPAQDIFERDARAAPLHPAGQFREAVAFCHKEPGLLLGEHTTGVPQGGDNSRESQGSGR